MSPDDNKKTSLGGLLARFSAQISNLFRAEVNLAKAQAKEVGKRFGLAGAMFAAAAVFVLFMLGWLLMALFFAFAALVNSNAVGALLTAAVLLVLTAIVVIVGLAAVKKAKEHIPAPQEGIKKDVEVIKNAIKTSTEGAEK